MQDPEPRRIVNHGNRFPQSFRYGTKPDIQCLQHSLPTGFNRAFLSTFLSTFLSALGTAFLPTFIAELLSESHGFARSDMIRALPQRLRPMPTQWLHEAGSGASQDRQSRQSLPAILPVRN